MVKSRPCAGRPRPRPPGELKALGFDVEVKPVAVNYIGAGLVVTSRPDRGDSAPKGSKVIVYVV